MKPLFSRSKNTPIKVLGHRGCRGRFAENTATAITFALEQNAFAVEIDLRLDGTNRIVLAHDANDLHSRELTQLHHVIDTLNAFPGVHQLEVKALAPSQYQCMINELQAILPRLNSVCITSFDVGFLRALRRSNSNVAIGLIVSGLACTPWALARGLGASELVVDKKSISLKLIKEAKRRGLKVSVWTVNSLNVAKRLGKKKVDQIITDRPHMLTSRLLNKR
ncbi:MAG: glycerophosphodiester phosphodiesterase [Gammaproteobacteria bacterium]|nr:glycerophosphodiester phosphodiesterase [Gammaproteobacteria bacterium]